MAKARALLDQLALVSVPFALEAGQLRLLTNPVPYARSV